MTFLQYFLGLGAALGVLLGLAMFCFRQLRLTPEEGLGYAVMGTMLLTYLAGLAGNALIAFYPLVALGIIGLILGILNRRITGRGLVREEDSPGIRAFFSPGIVFYLVLCGAAAVLFFGTCYQNWDEFVQWGKALRFMGETNRLPVGNDYDGLGYMQSVSTYFHYFVGRFTRFDEAASYVSNIMLTAAALPLCFTGAGKKDASRVVGFFSFLLLINWGLYELPFYNLYVDQALAYWTGAIIFYASLELNAGASPYRWGLVGLTLINLAMMKPQAGLLFAFMALCAILFMLPAGRHTVVRAKRPASKGSLKQVLIAAAVLIVIAVGLNFVWGRLVTRGGIRLNLAYAGERLADRAGMMKLFYTLFRGLFEDVAGMEGFTYVTLFACSAALTIIGRELFPKGIARTRFLRISILYLAGFAAYFAVVYLTYLFLLPEADGINGTSLGRYLSLYLMAGVPVMTAPFFHTAGGLPPEAGMLRAAPEGTGLRQVLCSSICLMLLLVPASKLKSSVLYDTTSLLRWDDPYYNMYMGVRARAERVNDLTGDARIYFINQESDSAAAAAEFAYGKKWDRTTGAYRFSEGGTGATTGLVSTGIENLPSLLAIAKTEYLYLDAADDYLASALPGLLGLGRTPESGDLYAISYSGDAVNLTFVENVLEKAPAPRAVEAMH